MSCLVLLLRWAISTSERHVDLRFPPFFIRSANTRGRLFVPPPRSWSTSPYTFCRLSHLHSIRTSGPSMDSPFYSWLRVANLLFPFEISLLTLQSRILFCVPSFHSSAKYPLYVLRFPTCPKKSWLSMTFSRCFGGETRRRACLVRAFPSV